MLVKIPNKLLEIAQPHILYSRRALDQQIIAIAKDQGELLLSWLKLIKPCGYYQPQAPRFQQCDLYLDSACYYSVEYNTSEQLKAIFPNKDYSLIGLCDQHWEIVHINLYDIDIEYP